MNRVQWESLHNLEAKLWLYDNILKNFNNKRDKRTLFTDKHGSFFP